MDLLEQAFLGLFSLSLLSCYFLLWEDGWTDEWMDRWFVCHWRCPRAVPLWQRVAQMVAQGWRSEYQMACHNRSRWTQALGLFLLLNRLRINSEKGRGVKKQRGKLRGGREGRQQPAYRVRKVKEKDVEEMWECEKGHVINKSIKLTFHLPTFCVLRSKKSTSCIFKRYPTSHLLSQVTKSDA